jgi:1,4-alpha-glucan branching enzyme
VRTEGEEAKVIAKGKGRSKGKVRVTFSLEPTPAEMVQLAGDFNGWRPETALKRQKDGSWKAALELVPGQRYEFRYLIDGARWANDPAADAYVANPYGAHNCVVDLETV